jgi:hypothetical protein
MLFDKMLTSQLKFAPNNTLGEEKRPGLVVSLTQGHLKTGETLPSVEPTSYRLSSQFPQHFSTDSHDDHMCCPLPHLITRCQDWSDDGTLIILEGGY